MCKHLLEVVPLWLKGKTAWAGVPPRPLASGTTLQVLGFLASVTCDGANSACLSGLSRQEHMSPDENCG